MSDPKLTPEVLDMWEGDARAFAYGTGPVVCPPLDVLLALIAAARKLVEVEAELHDAIEERDQYRESANTMRRLLQECAEAAGIDRESAPGDTIEAIKELRKPCPRGCGWCGWVLEDDTRDEAASERLADHLLSCEANFPLAQLREQLAAYGGMSPEDCATVERDRLELFAQLATITEAYRAYADDDTYHRPDPDEPAGEALRRIGEVVE